MIIRVNDVRRAGVCVNGLRAFFTQHGLDLNDFIEHGIEAERLLATGDAMAAEVVRKAREAGNGRQ